MFKLTSLALLAMGAQAVFPGADATSETEKKDVDLPVNTEGEKDIDNSPESEDRVDASSEIVGNSSSLESVSDGASDVNAKTMNIQAIVRLYDASKQLYDEVMKQYLNGVYNQYDTDGEKGLSGDEALEYFYDVLDVTRQHDALSIAKAAANISSGEDDDVIEKSEMENFLYKLFTGDYSAKVYKKSDLGINIDLETYNKEQ